MNKFKKILLGAVSVLTLGLFVVTGTKVRAASEEWYKADTETTTSAISAGKFFDGTSFSITSGVNSITKTQCGAGDVYLSTDTGKTGIKFTYGLNSASNGTTFTITAKYDVSISFYYTACDKGSSFAATTASTKSTKLQVDGTATTSSNVSHSSNLAYVYETTISQGNSKIFSLSSGKFVLFGVCSTYEGGKTNEEKIVDAKTAIKAIGTVEYSAECDALIAAATIKINVCDNKIDDLNVAYEDDATKNYKTVYETALSDFASAKTSAINNFTSAVTAIGEVTSESESSITAAENAYSILFGDALTDTNVVSSKNVLEEKKLAYADVMYDSYDKYINANTCTLYENGVSEKVQAGDSIFSLLPACKVNESAVFTYDGIEYTQRMQTAGSVGFKDNEVSSKAISFEAKETGVLKVLAMSASSSSSDAATRTLDVYRSGSKTAIYTSDYLPVTNAQISYIYVNIPSAGTYYIGSSVNNISIYYLEFIETSISAPVLEQQENADNTAIRYIATLSKVSNINEIVSWNATITVGTKNHTFDNQTAVYTSVAGTNGKEEVTNTYYLVATLKGIPTTFTGTIKCRFNVTLTNGTVQSNIISYTID